MRWGYAVAGGIGAVMWFGAGPANAGLRIDALPVGYGDCYVVEFASAGARRWTAMVDGGPAAGVPVLLRHLKTRGIRRLDAAFLTHPHPNHLDGLRALAQQSPPRAFFWTGAPDERDAMGALLQSLKRHRVPTHIVSKGWLQRPRRDLLVEVLHPATRAEGIHHNNLVLRIAHGEAAAVFTGDLAAESLPAVFSAWQGRPDRRPAYEVVTWPHHGDPLSAEGLRWLDEAAWVFLSVGPNSFGLPRCDLAPALCQKSLRTDIGSAASLVTGGAGWRPTSEAQSP
jgi:competence protein ComEC